MNLKIAASKPKSIRVLVTDDDPVMRSLAVAKLLKRAGEVVEAVNGQDAWRLLLSQSFDLALVDLSMPELDGFSLIQCMRGHPRTCHMPIVVITSNNDRASIERALEAGATSFLTKPVNWSLFDNHIDYLIRLCDTNKVTLSALAEAEATAAEMRTHVARLELMLEAGLTAAARAELASLSRLCNKIAKPDEPEIAPAPNLRTRDHAA